MRGRYEPPHLDLHFQQSQLSLDMGSLLEQGSLFGLIGKFIRAGVFIRINNINPNKDPCSNKLPMSPFLSYCYNY